MEMTPITEEELARVIKKSRPSSAPSPFDQISYTILKKCPALRPALIDLFNRVIMEGSVPSSWKAAAVKLILKSSAKEDPSAPGNFHLFPSYSTDTCCQQVNCLEFSRTDG